VPTPEELRRDSVLLAEEADLIAAMRSVSAELESVTARLLDRETLQQDVSPDAQRIFELRVDQELLEDSLEALQDRLDATRRLRVLR
jgi:hypothetical protein